MKTTMSQVTDFHLRHEFPVNLLLRMPPAIIKLDLLKVSEELHRLSTYLLACGVEDLRIARTQLMVEELGEVIEGLIRGDAVAMLDGLADLAYVVAGTAVAFGLPLSEAIDEVHRSNMTKDVDGKHKPNKGANYSPPNLAKVLRESMR